VRSHNICRSSRFLNIDRDLYSSALYCLTKLDAVVASGTIIVFDEFGSVLHEFRAVHDYLASYRRKFRVICSRDNFYTITGELFVEPAHTRRSSGGSGDQFAIGSDHVCRLLPDHDDWSAGVAGDDRRHDSRIGDA
jgi:hypothetical protein